MTEPDRKKNLFVCEFAFPQIPRPQKQALVLGLQSESFFITFQDFPLRKSFSALAIALGQRVVLDLNEC
jgi:hypothetical protein